MDNQAKKGMAGIIILAVVFIGLGYGLARSDLSFVDLASGAITLLVTGLLIIGLMYYKRFGALSSVVFWLSLLSLWALAAIGIFALLF